MFLVKKPEGMVRRALEALIGFVLFTLMTVVVTAIELIPAIPLLLGWKWMLRIVHFDGWLFLIQIAMVMAFSALTFLWWMFCGSLSFMIHMGYFDHSFEEDKPFIIRKYLGPLYHPFTYLLGILECLFPKLAETEWYQVHFTG